MPLPRFCQLFHQPPPYPFQSHMLLLMLLPYLPCPLPVALPLPLPFMSKPLPPHESKPLLLPLPVPLLQSRPMCPISPHVQHGPLGLGFPGPPLP